MRNNKLFIFEAILLLIMTILNFKIFFGFIFVILHETSHIVAAKIFGLKIGSVRLNITGARSEINDLDALSFKRKCVIYLAGPMINLFFVLVFLLLVKCMEWSFLYDVCIINFGLCVFNLLPAYPLDGSRILEMILEKKILYRLSKNIVVICSFIIAFLLLIAFIFSIYIHKINISFILAAVIITYSTICEGRKTMYMIIRSLYKKENLLMNKKFLENKNICIYYKCDLIKALSFVDRNKFNSFCVLNEGLKVLGIVYEEELIDAIKNYGNINFKEYMETKIKK